MILFHKQNINESICKTVKDVPFDSNLAHLVQRVALKNIIVNKKLHCKTIKLYYTCSCIYSTKSRFFQNSWSIYLWENNYIGLWQILKMFEILTPNLLVPYIFFYQVMQSLTNNMTDLKSKIIIWDETNCYIFMWFNCCIFYIIGHDLTTQIDVIINILYS